MEAPEFRPWLAETLFRDGCVESLLLNLLSGPSRRIPILVEVDYHFSLHACGHAAGSLKL